jgi:hypothetical protein
MMVNFLAGYLAAKLLKINSLTLVGQILVLLEGEVPIEFKLRNKLVSIGFYDGHIR